MTAELTYRDRIVARRCLKKYGDVTIFIANGFAQPKPKTKAMLMLPARSKGTSNIVTTCCVRICDGNMNTGYRQK